MRWMDWMGDKRPKTRQMSLKISGAIFPCSKNLSGQFQNLLESDDHLPKMPRNDKILNQNAGKHRDKSTYICSTPQPILPPMDTGWDPLAYTVMTTKAPTVLKKTRNIQPKSKHICISQSVNNEHAF